MREVLDTKIKNIILLLNYVRRAFQIYILSLHYNNKNRNTMAQIINFQEVINQSMSNKEVKHQDEDRARRKWNKALDPLHLQIRA